MSDQLSDNEINFSKREFPVILLLDNITGEANIGSLFRLADAFGVEKIIFSGSTPNLNSNRLKRTARNTRNTVKFEFQDNPCQALKNLKDKGFKAMALEITRKSLPLQYLNLDNTEKLILIAGNERHGISDEILKHCEISHHIEMFGENSSMNVAQSVGIALYEITKAMSQFHKK